MKLCDSPGRGAVSLAAGDPRAPRRPLLRSWGSPLLLLMGWSPRPPHPHGPSEMLFSKAVDFQKSKYAKFMNHRVPSHRRYQPTDYEHAANCATHAFWIIPSILGSSILYLLSDDQWEAICAWIYGFGLSSLFIVSTIFHTISWKKSHLRLNLRELGPWASHMRWIVWFMASVGATYVFFFHERYKIVELICYIVMGFFPALVIFSMANRDGLLELIIGGLLYCLGMVFFKSDGRIPFAHAIWHLFVAIGAGIHYYAIWKYLYKPDEYTPEVKVYK
ncbi:monocyte to macrophage differentiation factor 2 isoform X2 [Ambystoma mexicanum]|uniref:monocyte to macrophage differentiation factor 2 isoform X2 n=1 Tax=Ambystoma mexicanum TaxID=8296 RepID=UPI0037E76B44